MRIKSFNAKAFGNFTDKQLDLSSDKNFHLVYGPNEAGKSTLLRAITDAFYGIPQQSDDNHVHQYRDMRLEAIIEDENGRCLAFERRKGHRNTIRDSAGNVLDDGVLEPFLGVSKDAFLRTFGLDQIRLRLGGQSLVSSKGDVGESLFQAATGVSGLSDIISSLQGEAAELFKPRGQTQKINVSLQALKDVKPRITKGLVPSREWEAIEQEYKEKRSELDRIKTALGELRQRKEKLARVRRCLPSLTALNSHREELEELADLPVLPSDCTRTRERASASQQNAERERKQLTLKIEEIQSKLIALKVDNALLDKEEEITKLQARLESYRNAVEDSRQLAGELKDLQSRIVTEYMKSGCGVPLSSMEKLRLPEPKKKRIRSLAEEYRNLVADRKSVVATVNELEIEIAEYKKDLQSKGVATDLAALQGLSSALTLAQRLGSISAQKQDKEQILNGLLQEIEVELEALGLWNGSAEELGRLSVPSEKTIEVFIDRFRTIQEQLRETNEEIDRLEREQDESRGKLDSLESKGMVPTDENLVQARKLREDGWGIVRSLLKDEPVPEDAIIKYTHGEPVEMVYEQNVQEADDIVDHMRRDADTVAKKALLLQQIEKAKGRISQLNTKKHKIEVDLGVAHKEWYSRWQEAQIQPLSPSEMKEWLDKRGQILELVKEQREEKCALHRLVATEAEAVDRIKVSLQALGKHKQVKDVTSLDQLIMLGKEVYDTLIEHNREVDKVEEALTKSENKLKVQEGKQSGIDQQLTQWKINWESSTAQLQLPPNTTTEEVLTYLSNLDQVFSLIDEAEKTRKRKERQDEIVDAFQSASNQLIKQVGSKLDEFSCDVAVEKLGKLLQFARDAASTRKSLQAQLEEHTESKRDANQKLKEATDTIDELLAKARCEDVDELVDLEERVAYQKMLEMKVQDIRENLLEVGDGLTIEQLQQEVEGIDRNDLVSSIEEVELEIKVVEREQEETERGFWDVENRYKELKQGNSTQALDAYEEAESIMANIRYQVQDYVRVRLAASVLHKGIEAYREQNQNPIIELGSRIFRQLTGESFMELKVDYGDKDTPVLLGVRDNGATVPIEGMSDGTQDQLYLALRLASIQRYAENQTPLPFIVDDILIHFDDTRAKQALLALAELAEKTQVIFFTHHKRLVELADSALGDSFELHNLSQAKLVVAR